MHIANEAAIAAYRSLWKEQGDDLLSFVPAYMHGGFCRWVVWGIQPGDFLDAVTRSDLFGAVRHGDDENRAALVDWVRLFYNGAPAACHGSEKLAARWNQIGGMLGRCEGCNGHLDVPTIPASANAKIEGRKVCVGCVEEYRKRVAEEQEVAAEMEAEG